MATDEDASDEALLDRWCDGDKDAGERLFRRHYAAVYRFFAMKVAREDIDEPVQETFLACLRRRDQFRRESSFRTFLFGAARLVVHEHWRRKRPREIPVDFAELSLAALSTSVGTRLARAAVHGAMLEALRGLPLEQQLLLELHYWEGLTGDDLATVFDIAPATVRSRMFRAREALRARVTEALTGGEPPATDGDFDRWARSLRPSPPDSPEPGPR